MSAYEVAGVAQPDAGGGGVAAHGAQQVSGDYGVIAHHAPWMVVALWSVALVARGCRGVVLSSVVVTRRVRISCSEYSAVASSRAGQTSSWI